VRIGETSFWWASLGGAGGADSRAPLPGPLECDVAIIGAGYTGLWTAWYLKQADPSLHVVVLEREHAGFGASGRNGGWLSGLLAGSRERWAADFGRDAVIAAQREMFKTVDVVSDFCTEEGVDCDLVGSGQLDVATSEPGLARARALVAWQRSWGFGDEDWRLLSRDEVTARIGIRRARGGIFTPHCARVHPVKLVRGLAEAVERAGVVIYEHTPVAAIHSHARRPVVEIATTGRRVQARWVVRATEGYTDALARRRLIPMNSAMIVTEPVGDAVHWPGQELLRETAHLYCYLQRTADGRVAIGGRGIPYRYGSRTDRNGEIAARTVTELRSRLTRLFPALDGVRVDHGWAGVLGVARDWCPAVTADPATGIATAGGYVGDGVSTANLAGRTLRDLILGEDTALTRAPWARHVPPRWEPEPLRYVGIRSVYALYRAADALEERTHRPSRLAALATRVSGR
jgi:glycine/D-amino acid oxidase-like deaminating enzyme